jgi:hypothetical protein
VVFVGIVFMHAVDLIYMHKNIFCQHAFQSDTICMAFFYLKFNLFPQLNHEINHVPKKKDGEEGLPDHLLSSENFLMEWDFLAL